MRSSLLSFCVTSALSPSIDSFAVSFAVSYSISSLRTFFIKSKSGKMMWVCDVWVVWVVARCVAMREANVMGCCEAKQ